MEGLLNVFSFSQYQHVPPCRRCCTATPPSPQYNFNVPLLLASTEKILYFGLEYIVFTTFLGSEENHSAVLSTHLISTFWPQMEKSWNRLNQIICLAIGKNFNKFFCLLVSLVLEF